MEKYSNTFYTELTTDNISLKNNELMVGKDTMKEFLDKVDIKFKELDTEYIRGRRVFRVRVDGLPKINGTHLNVAYKITLNNIVHVPTIHDCGDSRALVSKMQSLYESCVNK